MKMVEIKVLEQEKDKLKIEINDNSTIISMINERIWDQKGVDVSAFRTGHQYLDKPVLVVRGKDTGKAVISAAEDIIEDIKSLRKQFESQSK
ncbi:MAG: hypothetical protein QMD85_01205 [Candidatus Aenigmarchaeota archaeon]|nr:hypothetical protein [Candidatus Aenigmarchaeota archaeon]MDI6722161.1 hypothetical protein [Candidatus Aenigmarchaeota archaeon]